MEDALTGTTLDLVVVNTIEIGEGSVNTTKEQKQCRWGVGGCRGRKR